MGTKRAWTKEALDDAESIWRANGRQAAAEAFGVTQNALKSAFYDNNRKPPGMGAHRADPSVHEEPRVAHPEAAEVPIDELVDWRIKRFSRKEQHEAERKLIPVTFKSNAPIGILHFGDPHVDDDGTDLALLKRHAELVRDTPGLHAASVGDQQNAWVGRLAHLWG